MEILQRFAVKDGHTATALCRARTMTRQRWVWAYVVNILLAAAYSQKRQLRHKRREATRIAQQYKKVEYTDLFQIAYGGIDPTVI
jgi:hypothetical protein